VPFCDGGAREASSRKGATTLVLYAAWFAQRSWSLFSCVSSSARLRREQKHKLPFTSERHRDTTDLSPTLSAWTVVRSPE
jgi:hypothetical protein